MSRAILNVTESTNMTNFEEELYGEDSTFTDKEDTTSSTSLTFRSFMGLFLLTGASSILALIIHMLFAINQTHNSMTNDNAPQIPPNTDEPMEEDQSNGHTMTTLNSADNVEISITLPDSESDIEEITSNEGGTPGREIANNELCEMPSFGEMLDHTGEGSRE
jgi:hypothetical protein